MTQTNNATTTRPRDLPTLPAGTLVVSTLDGEPGRIVQPSTYSRNGKYVWSYVVLTSDGREVWDVADLFLPGSSD